MATKTVEAPKDDEKIDPNLIEWEEFALATEEHFHAQERHRADPKGLPMGVRKKRAK